MIKNFWFTSLFYWKYSLVGSIRRLYGKPVTVLDGGNYFNLFSSGITGVYTLCFRQVWTDEMKDCLFIGIVTMITCSKLRSDECEITVIYTWHFYTLMEWRSYDKKEFVSCEQLYS